MKEEDKILKKIGTENPFRVPDGYFENLTSEVMNRLPEKEKLTDFSLGYQKVIIVYHGIMVVYDRHVYRCGIDYPRGFFGAYSICRAYGC